MQISLLRNTRAVGAVLCFAAGLAVALPAQAGYSGLKAALIEDAALQNLAVKIYRAADKAAGYVSEDSPLPVQLDLRTEGWLESIEEARKIIQGHEIEPLSAMPLAFDLNVGAAAIQGQVLRAEALLVMGAAQLDTKDADAKLLDHRRTYVLRLEEVVVKVGDAIGLLGQALIKPTDRVNLTQTVPYEALPKLEVEIADKRAAILAARKTDATILLGHVARTMQALDAEETKVKEAREANRKKVEFAQQLVKQIDAANQAVKDAQLDEVEAAERLDAASNRYTKAIAIQQKAHIRRDKARARVSSLQSKIDAGPWRCPAGNSWDQCTHPEKVPSQNAYYDARNAIDAARSEMAQAGSELKASSMEVSSSAQNKSACETAYRTAEARTRTLAESRDKLKADSQPTLDEVFNLIFAFGGDDLLTDIANARGRLSTLQQRLQGAAQ